MRSEGTAHNPLWGLKKLCVDGKELKRWSQRNGYLRKLLSSTTLAQKSLSSLKCWAKSSIHIQNYFELW